ncbi:MAG TPA: GNAT family N-acetyltransferase [Vicinamibacterales bacterium]|nr:GNAT family N-acetyltransferase [Vicinamibacterales bacterium]
MSITVRPMQTAEARRFLEVHHASVRGLAANDYPPSVVEAWAPPITDEQLQRFLQNRDGELRLIAERDGEAVGIGAIVAANSELRACYVLPSAARQGVGAAIVAEIERRARQHGLRELHLESSVTAEPFYVALGYRAEQRGEHPIAPGVAMAAITMRKGL